MYSPTIRASCLAGLACLCAAVLAALLGCGSPSESTDRSVVVTPAEKPVVDPGKKPQEKQRDAQSLPDWICVQVVARGFSAGEIEESVTRPAEDALIGIAELQRVQSVSRPDEALLWLEVAEKANADQAYDKTLHALDRLANLPEQAEAPIAFRVPGGPMLLVALHRKDEDDETESGVALRRIAGQLVNHLNRVPQVSEVSLLGGRRPRIEITVDPDRLAAFELTGRDIANMIRRENIDVPNLRTDKEVLVRSLGTPTVESLSEMPVIVKDDGKVIKLRDVAEVRVASIPDCDKRHPDSGVRWPRGWVLLGVRVASSREADDCAKRVEEALASYPLPDRVRVVRDLRDDHRHLLALARKSWARHIPPDVVLRHAVSPQRGSHLLLETPDFACRVKGPDIKELQQIAAELRKRLSEHPKVAAVEVSGGDTVPELKIDVNQDRAALVGVTARSISETVKAALDEQHVTSVQTGGLPADVVILPAGDRSKPEDRMDDLRVQTPTGEAVPLKQICTVTVSAEPAEILRDQRTRCVNVRVTMRKGAASPRDELPAIVAAMQADLAKTKPKYRLEVVARRHPGQIDGPPADD